MDTPHVAHPKEGARALRTARGQAERPATPLTELRKLSQEQPRLGGTDAHYHLRELE
jgi:hypothetical protein